MERTISHLQLNNNVTKDIMDKISAKQDSHMATMEAKIEDFANKLSKIEAQSSERESKLENVIFKLSQQVEYLVERLGKEERIDENIEKDKKIEWYV